jgi:hypothetical protein
MDWHTIALVVGALTGPSGLLIAALALYVSWRVYRRQVVDADLPLVTAQIRQQQPRWWLVTITVKNRSGVDWSAREAIVRRPRGARLARHRDALRANRAEPWKPGILELPDPTTLADKVAPSLIVRPAGSRPGNSLVMGTGDCHSASLLLFVPPSLLGRRRLSLHLVLCSNEAPSREITKTITRPLIDAKSAASWSTM